MGFLPPSTGAAFAPFYSPLALNTAAAAATDCGVTFNFSTPPAAAATAASRKRPHGAGDCAVSFLGEDISSHVQQQMLDIDRVVLHHAEKVRLELAERRRRFWGQLLSAIEQGVAKRLRAKDEEMERIGRMNWALEERIKSLCVETQIWRDMAETNEAAANVLRSNLEQVLAAQTRVEEEEQGVEAADDAESCCCGENAEELYRPAAAAAAADRAEGRRVCRNCRESEPEVLLLPCRHLCLCAACSPAAAECPVCHVVRDAYVLVKMS